MVEVEGVLKAVVEEVLRVELVAGLLVGGIKMMQELLQF